VETLNIKCGTEHSQTITDNKLQFLHS